MVWAGDPPHESPGWYGMYDTNEAMSIIAAQQQKIAMWIEENGKDGTCE
jgi:mannan endo-1,4-beta-mannosidase